MSLMPSSPANKAQTVTNWLFNRHFDGSEPGSAQSWMLPGSHSASPQRDGIGQVTGTPNWDNKESTTLLVSLLPSAPANEAQTVINLLWTWKFSDLNTFRFTHCRGHWGNRCSSMSSRHLWTPRRCGGAWEPLRGNLGDGVKPQITQQGSGISISAQITFTKQLEACCTT